MRSQLSAVLRRRCSALVSNCYANVVTLTQRGQSDFAGPSVAVGLAKPQRLTYEQVWGLWNEGNLFSMPIAQMQEFLREAGVATDPGAKKAVLVRRLEEYLHAKDSAAAGAVSSGNGASPVPAPGSGNAYGRWNEGARQAETLLDLAQSDFYKGTANMVPKAFQLLTKGTCVEAVVSRVNTTAFPGFPANTECYTLSASDADSALHARYSKVLQWCLLNMNNLRMDGELSVEVGKLVLQPSTMKHNESVVSTYTLQQRLQLNKSYTWVSTVPESAIAAVEKLLQEESFHPVSKSARLTYEGRIKRANDVLEVVLNDKAKPEAVYGEWIDIQTAYCTSADRPDLRVLLRSRPPVNAQDQSTYGNVSIVELAEDDVTDVLPPEHGQLIYLSENETRQFERLNAKGIAIVIREVKRQPLIVLRDDEEDARVEYSVSVTIPSSAGNRSLDVRSVGLEVFDLAHKMADTVTELFKSAYGF